MHREFSDIIDEHRMQKSCENQGCLNRRYFCVINKVIASTHIRFRSHNKKLLHSIIIQYNVTLIVVSPKLAFQIHRKCEAACVITKFQKGSV